MIIVNRSIWINRIAHIGHIRIRAFLSHELPRRPSRQFLQHINSFAKMTYGHFFVWLPYNISFFEWGRKIKPQFLKKLVYNIVFFLRSGGILNHINQPSIPQAHYFLHYFRMSQSLLFNPPLLYLAILTIHVGSFLLVRLQTFL